MSGCGSMSHDLHQVTSEDDVKGALAVAEEEYGGVNVAVSCAGIGVAMRTLSKKGPHPLQHFQVRIYIRPLECR